VSIDLSISFRFVLLELVAVFFFFGSVDLSVFVSVVVDAGLSAGGGVVVAAGAAADPAAPAAGAVVISAPLAGAFWASATPACNDIMVTAAAMKQDFCM